MKKFLQKLFFGKLFKGASLRDTIEELIEEDESSEIQSIDENEKEILGKVLDLGEIQIKDIMIPKIEIEALPANAKIEVLVSKFVETKKSSIIIYQGSIDNVLGVVYLKDIANWFYMNKPFNLSIFVKKVLFVPPTMKSLDLLFEMRNTGNKIAMVVDEYGDIDGLVSFGDIVEEIIGDIQDTPEIKEQKKKVVKSSNDNSIVTDTKSYNHDVEGKMEGRA